MAPDEAVSFAPGKPKTHPLLLRAFALQSGIGKNDNQRGWVWAHWLWYASSLFSVGCEIQRSCLGGAKSTLGPFVENLPGAVAAWQRAAAQLSCKSSSWLVSQISSLGRPATKPKLEPDFQQRQGKKRTVSGIRGLKPKSRRPPSSLFGFLTITRHQARLMCVALERGLLAGVQGAGCGVKVGIPNTT